jgi:hypothetical protein
MVVKEEQGTNKMIKLKDLYPNQVSFNKKKYFGETIAEAKVSDVKRMEKMADKIVADMKKLNQMFTKLHDSKTSNPSAYRTLKDWEQLQRDADVKYGSWFGYVYDSDNVEK